MEFTFGYDIENTSKVVQYLQRAYPASAFEVIFADEDYDDEDAGPTAIEVYSDDILEDEKFLDLMADCAGGGDWTEEDEDAYQDDHFEDTYISNDFVDTKSTDYKRTGFTDPRADFQKDIPWADFWKRAGVQNPYKNK